MNHMLLKDWRINIVLFSIACCLLLGSPIIAVAQDYVVVVNKSLSIDNISSSEIGAIFTGKKKFWDSGDKVVLAIYGDEQVQARFLKQHVHKTPSQYKNYWTKMVFTGKASMPDYLKSPDEVQAFVAATPGAISFVPAPGSNNVKSLIIR